MEARITPQMSVMDKLKILADAAKYDVSCSSSGSSRRNDGTGRLVPQFCGGRSMYLFIENIVYQ